MIPTKLFLGMYPAKFIDNLAKPFFLYMRNYNYELTPNKLIMFRRIHINMHMFLH